MFFVWNRSRNAHSKTVAKQNEYEKMKDAFKIKGEHVSGKAFGNLNEWVYIYLIVVLLKDFDG